jgi:membrane protein DedA with SNARE-associated domain
MKWITIAAAVVYGLTFVSSFFCLCMPGQFVPIFAFMTVAGALVGLDERRKVRIAAVAMVAFAAFLVVHDWSARSTRPRAADVTEQE